MPGITSGGLPYPVGTDHPRDGDNDIQALAEKIDSRQAWALVATGANLSIAPTGWRQLTGFQQQGSIVGTGLRVDGNGVIADTPGLYLVVMSAFFLGGGTAGGRRGLGMSFANGVDPSAMNQQMQHSSGTSGTVITASWLQLVTTSVRFAAYALQESTAAMNINSRQIFAQRVGYTA